MPKQIFWRKEILHFILTSFANNDQWFIGTVAEGAPIIPISAQLKYNIEVICEYICKKIPIPLRDFTSQPRLIGELIIDLYTVCII